MAEHTDLGKLKPLVRERLSALVESLGAAESIEATPVQRLCHAALTGHLDSPVEELRTHLGTNTDCQYTWADLLSTTDTELADQVTRDALDTGFTAELWERLTLALESRLVNAVRTNDSSALVMLLRAVLVAGCRQRVTIRQAIARVSLLPTPRSITQTVQQSWVLAEVWRPETTRSLVPHGACRHSGTT